MDNIEEVEVVNYEVTHHISCDKCGKHICDSEECDDGWWDNPAEYRQSLHVDNNWYKLEMELCEDCKKNVTNKITETLISLGFKKEEGW